MKTVIMSGLAPLADRRVLSIRYKYWGRFEAMMATGTSATYIIKKVIDTFFDFFYFEFQEGRKR